MVNRKRTLGAVACALCGIACLTPACGSSGGDSKTTPQEQTASIDTLERALDADALAIIEKHCAGCHGGTNPKARLSLEPAMLPASMVDVPSRQIDSLMLIDTRAPMRSYLLMKIRGDEGIRGSIMPDHAAPLSGTAIATIERWVHGFAHPTSAAPAAASDTGASKER